MEVYKEEEDFLEEMARITAALKQADIYHIGSYVLMDADDEPIGEEMDIPD